MKTHTMFGVGLTALILGGFAAGGISLAGSRDAAAIAKQTNEAAGKAAKALAKGDAATAVALSEAVVAMAPQDAGYRLLLGQSYLKAGRFTSAHQAFADVLALSPNNGKAALNLALSQIAEGQWDVARQTLSDYAGAIPARDRGLALALAGDVPSGLQILVDAARSPDADARTRQNLALTLALSGRWREAKTMVETDVSPQEANQRILRWIAFAKPVTASDQVAALLGVVAVKDGGQPVALALNAATPAPEMVAAAPVGPDVPTAIAAPVETAETAAAPAMADPQAAVAATVPVEVAAAVEPAVAQIVFGERREVVQPLPPRAARKAATVIVAEKGAFKTKVAIAAPSAKGNWYVQLGAFENAGVARDAWARAKRRYGAFASHAPAGMAFKGRSGAFYRLSVGGFNRAEAVATCRAYRSKGGACFVRAGAGDQVAQWVKQPPVQVASR